MFRSNGIKPKVCIPPLVMPLLNKMINASKLIKSLWIDPSSKDRDLTDVSANGSVVFVDGDNVARGEKLDYRISDETYDLFGPKAIVTSPRGIMTATGSITYNASDITNKQVIAIGAASYKDDNGRVVEGERVVAFLMKRARLRPLTPKRTQKLSPQRALSPPPTA